jgi:archaellum component FlaC
MHIKTIKRLTNLKQLLENWKDEEMMPLMESTINPELLDDIQDIVDYVDETIDDIEEIMENIESGTYDYQEEDEDDNGY